MKPALTFYHPNSKGAGGAVKFSLHPAEGVNDGFIKMRMAAQMTIDEPVSKSLFAWEDAIEFDLMFNDLCLMLQVFRGETECIERGILRIKDGVRKTVNLRHIVEPVFGYAIDVIEGGAGHSQDVSRRILLTEEEALGLCQAISGSMSLIAFGIPTLVG